MLDSLLAVAVEHLVISIVPALAQMTSADWVSNLLTGGGFVFLAAIMGALALWNKNQSEAISSVTKASSEIVDTTRKEMSEVKREAKTEVAEAKAEAEAAKTEARAARAEAHKAVAELEEEKEASENERRKFRYWIRRQKIANDEHKIWDDEQVENFKTLVARLNQMADQLRALGVADVKPFTVEMRPAPPLATCSPDDPNFPKI